MHPPGYPLAVTYFHLARWLPAPTPFTGAAWLNLALALAALAIVARALPRAGWAWALGLGALATGRVYWTYAVTPEVFSGLALFAAGFLLLAYRPRLYRHRGFVVFLALSLLHHHTVVFLAPILAWAAWKSRAGWRDHVWATASGATALLGYAVLLLFDGSSPWSWRELEGVPDIITHFLRQEYGTFSLMRTGDEGALTARAWFTIHEAALSLVGMIGAAALSWTGLPPSEKRRAGSLMTLALLHVLVFVFAAHINPVGVGARVYERFLLLPIFVTSVVAIRTASRARGKRRSWVLMLLGGQIALNLLVTWNPLRSDLREVPAERIRQVLESLPADAVLAVTGDSEHFIAGYWQSVAGLRRDVLTVPYYISPERAVQIGRQFPGRVMERPTPGLTGIFNYGRFPLMMLPGSRSAFPDETRLEYRDLSIQVLPGAGKPSYRCDPRFIYPGRDFPLEKPTPTGDIALQYGACDFILGLALLQKGESAASIPYLEEAVRKSPFHLHAKERLCHALAQVAPGRAPACLAELEKMLAKTHAAYLAVRFEAPDPSSIEILAPHQPTAHGQ